MHTNHSIRGVLDVKRGVCVTHSKQMTWSGADVYGLCPKTWIVVYTSLSKTPRNKYVHLLPPASRSKALDCMYTHPLNYGSQESADMYAIHTHMHGHIRTNSEHVRNTHTHMHGHIRTNTCRHVCNNLCTHTCTHGASVSTVRLWSSVWNHAVKWVVTKAYWVKSGTVNWGLTYVTLNVQIEYVTLNVHWNVGVLIANVTFRGLWKLRTCILCVSQHILISRFLHN